MFSTFFSEPPSCKAGLKSLMRPMTNWRKFESKTGVTTGHSKFFFFLMSFCWFLIIFWSPKDTEVLPHVADWEEVGDFPAEDLTTKAYAAGIYSAGLPLEYGCLVQDHHFRIPASAARAKEEPERSWMLGNASSTMYHGLRSLKNRILRSLGLLLLPSFC